MVWLDRALASLQLENTVPEPWPELVEKVKAQDTQEFYKSMNNHLSDKVFLLGHKLSAIDFHLADKLMKIKEWERVATSKTRPAHLSRWFMHVFSLFPNPEFAFYRKDEARDDQRLIKALRLGDMKIFHSLVGKVSLSARENFAPYPQAIHIASALGNIEAIEALLEKGASLEAQDSEGMTPIFYACSRGKIEMLEYLVSLGANIYHRENMNRSVFYWTANAGHEALVDRLFELGLDPNEKTDLGRTALSKAAWNGKLNIVVKLLKLPGINVDIPDNRGRTPLHNAVWGDAGGRIGKKLAYSGTDSPEIAELLIQAGADIEHPDNTGNTPLCIASSTHAPRSLKILLRYHANMHHINQAGYTPLHEAVYRGNVDCAKILISEGMNVNSRGTNGKSTLYCAIEYGQPDVVQFLLEFPELEVTQEDFIAAVEKSRPEILQVLIKQGRFEHYVNSEMFKIAVNKHDLLSLDVILSVYKMSEDDLVLAMRKGKGVGLYILDAWREVLPVRAVNEAIKHKDLWKLALSKGEAAPSTFTSSIKCNNFDAASELLHLHPSFVDYIDKQGRTCLHYACEKNSISLAQHILELIPNPAEYITLQDIHGLDAVHISEIHRNTTLSEFLRSIYAQNSTEHHVSHIKHFTYQDLETELPSHPLDISKFPVLYESFHCETLSIDQTPVVFVDTLEKLDEMREYLQNASIIGIDLEWFNIDITRGVVCLIQISDGKKDYVVDCLENRDRVADVIREIMIDSRIVKVFHSCDSDLKYLTNNFEAFVCGLFDTARAYCILKNDSLYPSLNTLVKMYFDVELDKRYQTADWRIRPLPKCMLEYARKDAHYLCGLYEEILKSMNEEMQAQLMQRCNAVCLKPPSSKLKQLKIKID